MIYEYIYVATLKALGAKPDETGLEAALRVVSELEDTKAERDALLSEVVEARDVLAHVSSMQEKIRTLEFERDALRVALEKIAYAQFDIGRPPIYSLAENMRVIANDALDAARGK